MSTYTPDCWVLVKIYSESVIDKGDFYEFLNSSGSVYLCHKEAQRMSGYMSTIFAGWKAQERNSGGLRIEIEEKIV